jgi:hypothetical protein
MVAIVPILLAFSILQWSLMFFGGEINNLHHITGIYHTKNVQRLLIKDLLKRRMMMIKEGKTPEEADIAINILVNDMLQKNNIKLGK